MEDNIFKYILRYSKKQQVMLLALALLSFPFLYLSLDIPKTIIDKAIKGSDFPQTILTVELDQIPYLMALCAAFLFLVMLNGGFKYFINVYRGVIGERMLRRLRYLLIERVMRFPLPHFRNVSEGEIVSMVTTETEPLGGFIGDAFSLPSFQGGILLTYIGFIFIQDPIMGLAAISLYPIQVYLIPKLQRQVNRLGKQRVMKVRKLSERLGEMVSGMPDIRAHDTAHFELADFTERLGAIFDIRYQIYRKKFFIKFLNNFLAQLTPFFFFSIGGYLVIKGNLTLGSLVAVLAAYKDLAAPWKELLNYYQRMEDSRIKYDQLIEQFQPAGMLNESLMAPQLEQSEKIAGKLVASNLSFEVEEGNKIIDGATFSLDTSEHVAIVGDGGSERTAIAQLLARLVMPSGGKIQIGEKNLTSMPNSVTGRNLSYVDQESYIRSGTILDALLYGLKHHPTNESGGNGEIQEIRQIKAEEAAKADNSPFLIDDDWVDYESIGVKGPEEMTEKAISALRSVGLNSDIFQIGLRQVINAQDHPELAQGILKARTLVGEKLNSSELSNLVEVFDKSKFNTNASVAENILFGAPADETFKVENLGENPHVLRVLDEIGLREEFLKIGHSIATLMVELFHGLPPGHEFFERFSFIDSDDLPEFQRINNFIATHSIEEIEDEYRARLTDLPFKIIVARHHLGLIDETLQARLLEARQVFSDTLPNDLKQSIAFFDDEEYNSASSIQDNILFGKIASNKVESASRIGDLLTDVIDNLGLRTAVIEIGLGFNVGIAGKRLSPAQRQKLAIARCLLKKPQLMIVNQATASLDAASSKLIFESIKNEMKEAGLVWVDNEVGDIMNFDRVLRIERGKITDQTKGEKAEQASAREPEQSAPESKDDTGGLNDKANLLSEIPFFSGIERSRLKLLAFTSEHLRFKQGEHLFWQGNMAEVAYVILEGTVDILIDSLEGPRTVATYRRGELIGELALLSDAPRTASVRAAENVAVMSISKDIFLKLIKENSEASANLSRILAVRFETMMRKFSGGQALYDETTGLPNRDLLKDRMKYMALADKRHGKVSALILIDMKNFEPFVGPLGKDEKDELLKEIARRLRGCLREADTLASLENYGFGVIANAAATDKGLDTDIVTKRLANAFDEPFRVKGKTIMLEKGLGFNVFPLTEENIRIAENIL